MDSYCIKNVLPLANATTVVIKKTRMINFISVSILYPCKKICNHAETYRIQLINISCNKLHLIISKVYLLFILTSDNVVGWRVQEEVSKLIGHPFKNQPYL